MTGKATAMASVRSEIPGIVALSLPMVAGLAAGSLLAVTDSLMLAPLGALPLAAVGLTSAFGIIVGAAVYGLVSAVQVRIGTAFGARQGRRIPSILRGGLALGAIAGAGAGLAMLGVWPLLPIVGQPPEVLAVVFPYWCLIAAWTVPFGMLTVFRSSFEAVGRPWIGTAFAYLAVALNIPLNYALIWGAGPIPALGLTGAGIGTLASEVLALAAAWGWWSLAPRLRRLRTRGALSRTEIAATAREGAPLGLMYLAETGAMTVATLMIGTFGTVALAGNQVAMALGGVLYMLPLGIAQAIAVRVAQVRGAGEVARTRPVAWAGLGLATAWLGTVAVLLGLFGERIAGAISPDPQVVAMAATILLVFAVMQVFDGVQSSMVGALRGLSDTGFAAWVSMAAYWTTGIPLGWVLAHSGGMGPAGVWLGWLVALAAAGVVLVWRFRAQTAP
ncbi:MAG: MATE family efflux transporter [Gemmobacter sp.]